MNGKDETKKTPGLLSMFEWYENHCETALRIVYRQDIADRQKLLSCARDLEESESYWQLVANFDDACAQVKDDPAAQGQVLLAFAIRMFAAGK
jgi:hypothetical protein